MEELHLNSFNENQYHIKSERTTQKEKSTDQYLLMNTNVKVLNKILATKKNKTCIFIQN